MHVLDDDLISDLSNDCYELSTRKHHHNTTNRNAFTYPFSKHLILFIFRLYHLRSFHQLHCSRHFQIASWCFQLQLCQQRSVRAPWILIRWSRSMRSSVIDSEKGINAGRNRKFGNLHLRRTEFAQHRICPSWEMLKFSLDNIWNWKRLAWILLGEWVVVTDAQ